MAMLQAFRYKPKNTLIHKFDPRTKLLLTIVVSILAMVFAQLIPMLILLGITTVLVFIAKSGREWMLSLRGLLGLIVFIIILNYITRSLNFAIVMGVRLMVLSSIFSVFFLTVHPDDLAQSLIQLHIPFDFAFALAMATRYVPTLALEAQTIMDSQKSRGLELEKGNFIERIKNFVPILVPLIVSSVRRALSIAESIESRAFGSTNKRTSYYQLKMQRKDYATCILAVVVSLTVIFFAISGQLPPWVLYAIPI
ncbi:MAG: energy-coupling factor transporter transmembrane component T family protein [Candidatus Ranarchaeia archaeon]|jgi:energy-coupling factor transport system permease protein